MEKKTVLTVDDEAHILELLKYNLEANGYAVLQAETGEEALALLQEKHIDAVLLDLMLPQMDGLEVLKRIRMNDTTKNLPVIMLTAKGEEFDKVLGLEMGADDYIAKPFGIRELLARLKAVARRSNSQTEEKATSKQVIVSGGLKIGIDTRTVTVDGIVVEMSLKEFELLKLLAENPGRVYSRDMLLEKVWGYEYMGETRTVDVHIRHIRRKIESDDANPKYIKTVRGFGYKFREEKA